MSRLSAELLGSGETTDPDDLQEPAVAEGFGPVPADLARGPAVLAALWGLVWDGRVGNDTFAPVRGLLSLGKTAHRTGRQSPRARTARTGGAAGASASGRTRSPRTTPSPSRPEPGRAQVHTASAVGVLWSRAAPSGSNRRARSR